MKTTKDLKPGFVFYNADILYTSRYEYVGPIPGNQSLHIVAVRGGYLIMSGEEIDAILEKDIFHIDDAEDEQIICAEEWLTRLKIARGVSRTT